MKKLIFIIITFMHVATAYAQEIVNTTTATEIITKGANYDSPLVVVYKKEIYVCVIDFREMICTRPADRGVSTDL